MTAYIIIALVQMQDGMDMYLILIRSLHQFADKP